MHGSTWENTPDGRPGWLQLLVSQGFEVHVVDNVERGRSGFAVGVWEGEPLARSLEEAWTLFRIGEAEDFKSRMPFQGSRFPVEHFANFSKMLVPRWLSTSRLHIEALLAVLERTGPAVVFCHSQGGEIAVDALQRAPEHFVALVAIEPSVQLTSFEVIRHIPTVLMAGDFLDRAEHWSTRLTGWQYWAETVSQQTANALLLDSSNSLQSGHTHLPMLDRGSELCLAACLDALEKLGVLSEFQPDLQQ
jgi:pimeloyl-ACP methyl ester carboxylesterase